MTLSAELYLPIVNLSLCGQTVLVGQPLAVDLDCADTQQSIAAGILVAPDADGSYPQRPVTPGFCCGGGR